jgi:hypothetical protein
MNSTRHLLLLVLLEMLTAGAAGSQELVPRRWSHLPMRMNFAGAGYAFTHAKIDFDPVLQVEDAELDLRTVELSFIRTLELLGKSARVDLRIPFQDAHWQGLLAGQPASVRRRGMADPVVRMAINLVGSPPLEGKEFVAHRAANETETLVGAGLAVHLPLGQYFRHKLLNLGSNRFTIRPQLGVVHRHGNWTAELTGSTWFFTNNDSFFNGSRRKQDPLLTVQAHFTYDFHPRFWASVSGGVGYGGESTIEGDAIRDTQRNVAWALSLGYSLTRDFGLKLAWVGIDNLSDVGSDSSTLIVGASYFW